MQDLPDFPPCSKRVQEECSLAAALDKPQSKHSLVYFHSSRCRLCQAVAPIIEQESTKCESWLNVSSVCTDDQYKWAPEMISYQVDSVPCFVLLNSKGHAIAKSGKPRSRAHVASTLQTLLRLAKLQKQD